MDKDQSPQVRSGRFNRRQLLLGGATIGAGALAAVGVERLVTSASYGTSTPGLEAAEQPRFLPFHGEHQTALLHPEPAHQNLVSLTLRPDTDRDAIQRLLRILTDDAARITQGVPALADSEPELAVIPANLTVLFGVGPQLVERAQPHGGKPAWLRNLPAFGKDQLDEQWNGGDLLLQIASDDAITLAHATRMLLKDARSFADVKWVQAGFRRAYGSEQTGQTQRNLFGQLDGTVNPTPGSADFEQVVWHGPTNPGWLEGGTSMVIRRIHMHLDKWDRLDRRGREESVGRTLDSGAPLTGVLETDEPDFDALTPIGFPVIAEYSHIRRARSDNPRQRILRRSYNYDLPPADGTVSNAGLIFTSFQADVDEQFTPIQQRLDELDLLNEWITHIGSAVFAVLPGCEEGGFIGETLFH